MGLDSCCMLISYGDWGDCNHSQREKWSSQQRILEGEFDVWQSSYLMISYPTLFCYHLDCKPAAQCLLVHGYGGCRICLQSDKIIHCNLLVCSMIMWWNSLMTPLLASLHFFIQDFLRKKEPASGLSLQTIWPHGSHPTSWYK
jgi:hypothetical protein